jgi:transcriptional regulator with XRE-family HTH domain
MPDTDSSESFASVLRAIKDRTGDSYETLARQVGIASSTLHRYCSGRTLPVEFGVIERIGRACDADRDDLIALHRAWAATAAARTAGTFAPARPEPATDPVPPAEPGRDVRPELTVHPAAPPEPAVGPGPAAHREPDPEPATPGRTGRRRAWWGALARGSAAVRRTVSRPSPYALAAEPAIAVRNWALLLLVAVLGLTVGAWHPGGSAGAHPLADPYAPQQVLLQPGCEGSLTVGRHDQCVLELQRQLQANGARLAIDGNFGEATQRRVYAFQALVGDPDGPGPAKPLAVNGVVDDATKRALYRRTVWMGAWDTGQVEEQIRRLFPEDPESAVRLAMCESALDPMWVSGPVGWGVFGLTGDMLTQTGYTRQVALDPLKNITIARALWLSDHSFDAWPPCQPLPHDRGPL